MKRTRKWRRRFKRLFLLGALASLWLVWYAARTIEKQERDLVFLNAAEVPHERVGLVLGCAPVLGGHLGNPYFENRMDAAATLFKAGKIDCILASGDNHAAEYDEPTAMKDALVRRGVPEDRIVLDYAGFSTSDSILRAKSVFELKSFCVVSQRDHAMRALYIARHHGLDAVGYAAEDIPARYGWRVSVREAFARARTILDVHVWGRKPHFGGPPIPIEC